jgi:hypothetical protein
MPFKAGHDSNRYTQNNGVMQFHKRMSELVREQCLDAVKLLTDTVENEKAPLKLRIVAAKEILDRGLGRPIDTTVHLAMGAEDAMTDVSDLTDTQLEALARTLIPTPKSDDKDVIEAEFTET